MVCGCSSTRKADPVFSSSKTSSNQTYQTGTDQATNQEGKGNVKLDSGSLALLGKESTYLSPGSIDFSKVKGNITYSPGVSEEGIRALVNTFTSATREQIAAASALAQKTQDQVGTLAENSQTGDDKTKNAKIIWLAALAIVALAAILWKKL